jgi:hypothetical protein
MQSQLSTYYAVFVLNQEDKRPVIVARYEDLALAFAKRAFGELVPYSVQPVQLDIHRQATGETP